MDLSKQRDMHVKSPFYLSRILVIACLLTACTPKHNELKNNDFIAAKQCAQHVFLEKYGCSILALEQNAENGDADAAYALGYICLLYTSPSPRD